MNLIAQYLKYTKNIYNFNHNDKHNINHNNNSKLSNN